MNTKNKSIIFVDDEKQILKALNRLFMDSGYTVFMAESGEQALDILGRDEIDMIITDMRMPAMDGYQLLKAVKEKYPSVLRLILSGYTDEEIVFRALRQNLAKLYIFKPWDNSELMTAVDKVFETERIIEDKSLSVLINNLEELPMITGTYNRLCSLIEQEAEIKKISAVIEEDQSVAAKVLHIANSAFYGVKTGSINQAVMYLGLSNIRNIVLTTTIFEKLKYAKKFSRTKKLLWEHSCLCNKAVMSLYEKLLRKMLPDIYASSGLLHDIGKIVFMSKFPNEYSRILESMYTDRKIFLIDMETEAFSASHQEVGAYLLDWWELPHPIVEAVLFHHSPLIDRVVNKELVSIVHIADYFTWELMGQNSNNALDENVFKFLNTSMLECKEIVKSI